MRFFFLAVFTFIVLSVSAYTSAHAKTSDLLAAQPVQIASSLDVPVCYIQWVNSDRLVDLTQLCGKQPQNLSGRQLTYPQPPAPYNQSAMKKFDDSLYGDGK